MQNQKIKLNIDGSEREFDGSRTFGEISEELKTEMSPERVITEISVNGAPLDLNEETSIYHKPLSDLGNVDLKSRDVGDLFKDSLVMAPQICEALQLDCDDIQAFFAEEKVQEAHERIGEMTSLIEWLLQLISGVQMYGSEELKEMQFSHGTVLESVHRMEYLLAKLHKHLASSEFKDFSEILRGEFKHELGVWKTLFEEVSIDWTPRSLKRDS